MVNVLVIWQILVPNKFLLFLTFLPFPGPGVLCNIYFSGKSLYFPDPGGVRGFQVVKKATWRHKTPHIATYI